MKNGVIVSSEENYDGDDVTEYFYKNNRLVEIWENDDNYYRQFVWENGNLTKETGDEGSVYYEYYTYDNNFPPFQQYCGQFFDNLDPLLAFAGYYGLMPKNLVKSINYDNDYTYNLRYRLNDDGFPIWLQCTELDCEMEFTWKNK